MPSLIRLLLFQWLGFTCVSDMWAPMQYRGHWKYLSNCHVNVRVLVLCGCNGGCCSCTCGCGGECWCSLITSSSSHVHVVIGTPNSTPLHSPPLALLCCTLVAMDLTVDADADVSSVVTELRSDSGLEEDYQPTNHITPHSSSSNTQTHTPTPTPTRPIQHH